MPYVTIKGKRMFYEEAGSGFPLLFGHSYLWDAAMWSTQVEALSHHYRCIVPELWAHGRSEPLSTATAPYPLEALADDYWDFVQTLGLERFAVIGLSVGGMWGAHLTLAHPEAVAALVLMGTYVGPEPPERQARFFQMLDAVEQAGRMPPPIINATVPFFFAQVTMEQKPALIEAFKERLAAIPPASIPTVVAIGRGIFGRNSVLDRLAEITIPTLIIVGEEDRSRPPYEAQDMSRRIPGARLEVLTEAGHICAVEQPEHVTELLRAFLNASL